MDNKIKLFENKRFKQMLPKWETWRVLLEGDREKLLSPEILWLHEYEADSSGVAAKSDGAKFRTIRCQRSRYLNLQEPIVSRWTSFLFRGEMTIPDSVKAILTEEMINDFDGKGHSLKAVAKDQICKNMISLGDVTAIVDTPPVAASTAADAKEKGLRPYVTVLTPQHVPDWSLSTESKSIGKPKFVRTQFSQEAPREKETEEPKSDIVSVSYRLENGQYTQYKYKKVDRGENEWDLVDKIPFPSTVSQLPITIHHGESFIKDSAEMQLLLFNFMSAESSCLNAQAFRMVFISDSSADNDRVMTLNEYAFNLLSEGATVNVVEPVSTATLENAIMRVIDWVFKVAFNQVDGLSASSKESPSAETRRQMKDEFIALVEDTLTDVENILNSIVGHVAMLRGEKPPTEKITISKTVTDEDYEEELAIWQAFADQFKQIASVNKAMLKRQIKRLGFDGDKEIEKDIESFDSTKQSAENQQVRSEKLMSMANGDTGTATNQE